MQYLLWNSARWSSTGLPLTCTRIGDPGGIRTRDLDLERVASWARLDDGVHTIALHQRNQRVTLAEPSEDDKLSRAPTPPRRAGGWLRRPLRAAGPRPTRRFP